ncbi:sigma-70 family RNA polymerase sigma factor [Rhizohabitans arisaemae]|uniref:sigma-70 family RNA polymerase sigma factor n=1 Tax=Rhizohabitans arisaemae TaxID=2720610 RepID=UPI0024B12838|nr:sigma-70 family RNA polymerase sigma factor [Rhizohabitans arisaemae]
MRSPATDGRRRADGPEARLEGFRGELIGYCYRMLGSAFEAEDAVQETLVRAWRGLDRFDAARGSLRTWVYAIATNVCLDMLRSAQRRALAMDLAPAAHPGADIGLPLPDSAWVQPIPDSLIFPLGGDPADLVARRETVRLAFIAALQRLPPRQRATLILRDVLCWKADEVARLLDTTVASVTSALQRARSTLKAVEPPAADPYDPADRVQRDLLDRYCDAFERHDVDALVSLLHKDATTSMPPFLWWLRGRTGIREVLSAAELPCADARLVPTVANGSPAFGQYWPSEGGYRPFALLIVEVSGDVITSCTTYLETARPFPLFPLFGLPAELP